jgi:DNA mismatch repair ATPase MutS
MIQIHFIIKDILQELLTKIKKEVKMSGGYFEYEQYKIDQIADKIERLIEKNGREKTKEELKEESWRDLDWYEKYPEDKFHHKYPDEVIEKFKEGLDVLRKAALYTQRIDWLLSGDDGEETFLERLKNELNNLNKK